MGREMGGKKGEKEKRGERRKEGKERREGERRNVQPQDSFKADLLIPPYLPFLRIPMRGAFILQIHGDGL
jgi:hypothetical protein